MVRILAFLLVCLSVAWAAQTERKEKAEFRFRINEDLGTLDWGYGEVAYPVVQQIMEGLTLSGKNGEPVPAIAASWESIRGKNQSSGYVFHLRKAKWSDGQPVCARHFVDAWIRVLSPEFGSPYAHYLFDVKNARAFHDGREKERARVGLRAEGCDKLVVLLEREASYFPAITSHWVLNPVRLDLVGKHGKSWTRPGNLAVTGPYVLEDWRADQYFLLRRNPSYYGAPAREERLRAVVVPDDATALSLFSKGMLDWVKDVPFLEKEKLAKKPEFRLFPTYISYHLGFRRDVDRESRCALAKALDKRRIPEILRGGEIPAWQVLPPEMAPRSMRPATGFDLEAAKKRWSRGDKPLEVYFYGKDIHVPLMEWVQEEWRKNLGANVRLTKMEGKVYWAFLQKEPPPVFLSGITAPYAHPYAFLSEFLSDSPANWGRIAIPEYDSIVKKVAALSSSAEQARAVDRSQDILLDKECAIIPLYFRKTASLVSAQWKGFALNPMSYVYLKEVHR